MAQKLYPPRLEGTLPAFYKSYTLNSKGERILQGATITIPFGRNPAVNSTEVKQVILRLRTISTNYFIIADMATESFNMDEGLATFVIAADNAVELNEGQYYRVQLAFQDADGITGYYSTVGVIKCVAQPKATIEDFKPGIVNSFLQDECIGNYEQDTYYGDTTEKVYSYKFILWDSKGDIVLDTGDLLHDTTRDVSSDKSSDVFDVYINLRIGAFYYIQYSVTTLNGLVVSSPRYKITKTISVEPEFPIYLYGEPNPDEGYINLTLRSDTITRRNYDGSYQKVALDTDFDLEHDYYILKDNGLYELFTGTSKEFNRRKTDTSSDKTKQIFEIVGSTTTEVEAVSNSVFVIKRSSSKDNYYVWQEITRFVLNTSPSLFSFKDFTIEQGISYKYTIQQYNIYNIYSNQIPMGYGLPVRDKEGKILYYTDETDSKGRTHAVDEIDDDGQRVAKEISIDYEDMFLYDGERQLKIRFNPHVKSFKTVIPEQKIETIGSNYPYIFRNGIVNYKEFPIEGLISYLEDEALLFLNTNEAIAAGILEDPGIRASSYPYAVDPSKEEKHESRYKIGPNGQVLDAYYDNGGSLYTTSTKNSQKNSQSRNGVEDRKPTSVRKSTDLTADNIMGERYFKLKVLDWLNDGRVKLFRSATEGMYLVRLMNVTLSPEETLGRMIHNFSCTGYEIAEVTYDNLVAYGIVHPKDPSLYETHWGSADVTAALRKAPVDGFYQIPLDSATLTGVEITDFAPGDIIKLRYNTNDPDNELVIGVTGSLNLNADSRTIAEIWIKPNPDTANYDDFSRSLIYTYTGLQLSAFDTIKDVSVSSIVSEQFVGPQENVLEPYNLRNHVYGEKDPLTGTTPLRITDKDGYDDLFADLTAHKRFTYQITDKAEKFTGHKIDILQVHKRDIIPIFSRDAQITDDTIFDVTPFGQPYIPTGMKDKGYGVYNISNFVTNNQIDYANNDILSINPYAFYGGVNVNDIYPLLEGNNPNINHFTILKAYTQNDEGNWEPVITYGKINRKNLEYDDKIRYWILDNEEYIPYQYSEESWLDEDLDIYTQGGKYFDTYTELWWDDGTEYNPSFAVNDSIESQDEESPVGDNNIWLNEINNITLRNLGLINKLTLGNGVFAEISIQLRVVDYDIEGDEPVKGLKNAYLQQKQDYEDALDRQAKHADQVGEALIQEAEVQALLDKNADQLAKYNGATTAIDNVLTVIQQRMRDQKVKLYNTAIERYEAIEALMETLDAPLNDADIDFTPALLLENITTYNNTIKNDEGEIIHPLNEYKERTIDNRTLERYGFSTTPEEHLDWKYIYKPQYEQIIANNNEAIGKANDEIKQRQQNIGNINGYFSDALGEDLKDGTIAYYEKQIDEKEASKEKLTEKYNAEMDALNDKITEAKQAILYADLKGDKDDELDQYTDQYILDNINAIRIRLSRLIDAVNSDLDTLDTRFVEDIDKLLEEYEYEPVEINEVFNSAINYYQLGFDSYAIIELDNIKSQAFQLEFDIDPINLYTKPNNSYEQVNPYQKVNKNTEYSDSVEYWTVKAGRYERYEYDKDTWKDGNDSDSYLDNIYTKDTIEYNPETTYYQKKESNENEYEEWDGFKAAAEKGIIYKRIADPVLQGYTRITVPTSENEIERDIDTIYYVQDTKSHLMVKYSHNGQEFADDDSKDENAFKKSTWIEDCQKGIYTLTTIDNEDYLLELNKKKIEAVNDYLAEYNAITKEHKDDSEWLLNHFEEYMDNYMVIVKKEE